MTAESARELAYRGHVAEEATIEHLVRTLSPETPPGDGKVFEAVTESGLVVEEQVRKAWSQPVVGLAVF
jgi:hypothetical protein